ncbi:MAG TPA: xanthine dehydrogenase family protein subunit M [Chloroflexota bacterium]|nr:xanthine dehydrogenase family protein subunit M [Chloroflexota bacterium]
MMRLPAFQYVAPRTVAEAASLLANHGPQAALVAGGTDLYPNMKRRQVEPKVVIGLRAIDELRGVSGDTRQGLTVRANQTLTEVANDARLALAYPAVARATGKVSTVHLRNMGTLGGNLCLDTRCNYYDQNYEWREALGFCKKKDGDICWVATSSPRCWAVSSSDTAPVMVALDAKVRLVSARGERVIPAEALYRNDGINYLTKQPDEILTEVILPPAEGLEMSYWKLRRRDSFDFPILGVAAVVRRDGGTVREARVVLGAVTSAPVLAAEASAALVGQPLTAEVIDQAAKAARLGARPLDNTDLTNSWRRRMVEVYVRRALREIAGLPITDYEIAVAAH